MMKQTRHIGLAFAALALVSCGNNGNVDEPETAVAKVEQSVAAEQMEAKAVAPFAIRYEVIGTPMVGSPVTLDLKISSAMGPTPVEISYQIPDASSMLLHESQPRTLTAEFADNDRFLGERVTVVPQREGRLYLNVSAAAETEDGRITSVTSIPLHVGAVDTGIVEHGEVEIGEDGEAVKVLRD